MGTRHLQARRRKQTLDGLEGEQWGPPTHETHLVITCHRLRTKPIGEFTVEDLRTMIGQKIGLLFLVPLALEVVEQEPLAEGSYYPGDLLCSLMDVSPDFWHVHQTWKSQLDRVVEKLPQDVDDIADDVMRYLDRGA